MSFKYLPYKKKNKGLLFIDKSMIYNNAYHQWITICKFSLTTTCQGNISQNFWLTKLFHNTKKAVVVVIPLQQKLFLTHFCRFLMFISSNKLFTIVNVYKDHNDFWYININLSRYSHSINALKKYLQFDEICYIDP